MNTLAYSLDLLGVAVFAASGALKASQKQMDIFGFMLTAAVTGVGGGTLRDLLLGVEPVFWVTHNEYIVVCMAAAIVIFFLGHRLARRQRWLLWADAVGLATFSVLGARAAVVADAPMAVAVLMGVMTACFGGIIRDVLCAEVPLILRREIYATAAAVGAILYVVLQALLGLQSVVAIGVGFGVALAARGAGILFNLSLPAHNSRA